MRIEIKDNKCTIDFENNTVVYGDIIPGVSVILDGKDIPITHACNGVFVGELGDKSPMELYNIFKN